MEEYEASYLVGHHVSLKHQSAVGKEDETVGWKFHISIDESDPKNIEKTWDAIMPILMWHKVKLSKFIKSERLQHPKLENYEVGRDVTIYCSLDKKDNKFWEDVLTQIAEKLVEIGVAPGPKNAACKMIKGSQYISYRYDRDDDGKYVSCKAAVQQYPEEKRYNPAGVEDIYDDVQINVANQPEPVVLMNNNADSDHDNDCCCRIS